MRTGHTRNPPTQPSWAQTEASSSRKGCRTRRSPPSSDHVERVAMETSTSIASLYRRLVEKGYDITFSHLRKTRYIVEVRIKSDRVDSRDLAELLRLNSLPKSYMPPRHRLASGEGEAPGLPCPGADEAQGQNPGSSSPTRASSSRRSTGCSQRREREWLRSLGLDPLNSYLRVVATLKEEIRLLSLELRHIAAVDEDVRLLMSIPVVGYYIALR